MIFGEKLKALRAERNMTQKELAKALGVSLRTVSNYETGGLRPRYASVYDDLARISRCRRIISSPTRTPLCWRRALATEIRAPGRRRSW